MTVVLGQPAIFGLLNHAAGATITPAEEATGYDADNLKTASYSTTYRTTGVTAGRTLGFDLGSVKSDVEVFALFGTNLTDAATWQVIGDDDPAFGSPHHDSGAISAFDVTRTPAAGLDDTPPWGRPLIFFTPATWSARYWRISLTDTANADGYLEAAYAVIGPVLQLGTAVTYSPRVEWVGGAGIAVARQVQTMSFLQVSEATRRQALSMSRALRQDGRFGLVPHPASAASWLSEAMLCRLAAPIDEEALPGDDWNLTMQLSEVLD